MCGSMWREGVGSDFSEVNLRQMRHFYEIYSIQQTPSVELSKSGFQLSWSHYLVLMRIEKMQPNEVFMK